MRGLDVVVDLDLGRGRYDGLEALGTNECGRPSEVGRMGKDPDQEMHSAEVQDLEAAYEEYDRHVVGAGPPPKKKGWCDL